MQRVVDNPDSFTLNRGVTVAEIKQLQDEVHDIRQRLESMAQDNARIHPSIIKRSIDDDRVDQARATLVKSGVDKALLAGDTTGAFLLTLDGADAAILRLHQHIESIRDWWLDPKWFLVRMPYPLGNNETESWDDPKLRQELTNHYFERPAKRRCRISPSDRGCLTNAAINMWSNRIRLEPAPALTKASAVGDVYHHAAQFDDAADYRVAESRLRRIDFNFLANKDMAPFGGFQFFFMRPGGQIISPGVHGGGKVANRFSSLALDDDEYIIELAVKPRGDPTIFSAFQITTNKDRVFDAFKAAKLKSEKPTHRFTAPDNSEILALHGHVLTSISARTTSGTDQVTSEDGFLNSVGPWYRNLNNDGKLSN
jgi:hypothetical protein